jgi:DnaJ-class molecular chaperone
MMDKLVECPNCSGRGTIGFRTIDRDGVGYVDVECPFCQGTCFVRKGRAERYAERQRAERKGPEA